MYVNKMRAVEFYYMIVYMYMCRRVAVKIVAANRCNIHINSMLNVLFYVILNYAVFWKLEPLLTLIISARQYMSKDMVEVGVVNLRQTVHAEESPVAFFRIKSLKDYITQHIERQMDMNNTWTNDNFNNELWIKIGVSAWDGKLTLLRIFFLIFNFF